MPNNPYDTHCVFSFHFKGLVIFLGSMLLYGCGCGYDSSPDMLFHTCKIFDQNSGENIYGWSGSFPEDSLIVRSANGAIVDGFSIDEQEGLIYIPTIDRNETEEYLHSKTYLFQFSKFDQDTLTLEYLFSKKGKCDIISLESISATYNDSLYINEPAGLYFEYVKK